MKVLRGSYIFGAPEVFIVVRIGSLTVTSVIDGEMRVPLEYFYPADDISVLDGFSTSFDPISGQLVVSIGAHLIRAGDRLVLVDAGIGAHPKTPPVAGGSLRSALLAHGVSQDDITDVVFSHLHFDHIGWATIDGRPFFRNATYRCDRRDWDYFMAPEYDTSWEERVTNVETDAARVRLAALADRMAFWEGAGRLLPGIEAVDLCGHTPGSTGLLLSSEGERGLLLGDVVHTQPELVYGWRFRTHVDSDRALGRVLETREFLATEGVPCSGAHFPGLSWGRVVRTARGYGWQDVT